MDPSESTTEEIPMETVSDAWPPSDPSTLPKLWGNTPGLDWGNLSSDEFDQCQETLVSTNEKDPQESVTYAHQISKTEYKRQANEFTEIAVEQLMVSEEYKRRTNRCQMCWCCWHDEQYSTNCEECGGYAMVRPCPVCEGRCGSVWSRDVDMTHSHHHAHWEGECFLSKEEQEMYLRAHILDSPLDENALVDDFQDLQAHSD